MKKVIFIPLSRTLHKVIDYRGKTPKKLSGEWSKSGYRAISALNVKSTGLDKLDQIKFVNEDLYKKWMKEEVNRGDILLTSEAPAGRVLHWDSDEKIVLSQRLFALRTNNRFNSKYLSYYLKSDVGQRVIFNKVSGSTVFGISAKMFDLISVINYDLPTQQKIASVLSALDLKIELNNKINAELEAMAKLIYDYWFVQFDFPDENGKPYKTNEGKMVWSEELKRKIPEGWDSGTLEDVSNLIRGVSYNKNEIKKESNDGVIPILRATNISGNIIDLDNMVYVPKQNVSSVQYLVQYDILITMSSGSKDHIGKNGFFYYDKEVSFGAFCAKLVAKQEFQFYLYSYTQSDYMFASIQNECIGTNINNLNSGLVNGFKIVVPCNKVIKLFNQRVSPIFEKVGNNLNENQNLTKLRDWLLQMLMNGQVKVVDSK